MGIFKELRIKLGLRKQPRIAADTWAKWYLGKEFSADWADGNFPTWDACLAGMRGIGKPLNILEIGSWEGRSAIFFLEYFERSTITCIDTFDGGQDEYGSNAADFPVIEQRFDANLSSYPGRVRKMKSTSVKALAALGEEGASFDLIYIDGAHDRDSVHVDSLLAWPLLKNGGVTIWDDYGWRRSDGAIDTRPEEAINLFVASRHENIKLLHRQWQVIARKVCGDTPKFEPRLFFSGLALRALRIRHID